MQTVIDKQKSLPDQEELFFAILLSLKKDTIRSERTPESYSAYAMQDTGFRFDRYNTWSAIEEHLYKLRDENPDLVTLIEIGRTHENRSILVVKVSGHRSLAPERVSVWFAKLNVLM